MPFPKSAPAVLFLALASCSTNRTTSSSRCNCGDDGGDGGQAGEATGGAGTSPGGASTGGRGGGSTGGAEGGEGGAGEGGCANCGGEGGEATGGLGGSAGTAGAGLGGVSGSSGAASGSGGVAGAGLGGLGGAGVGGAGLGGKAGGGAGGCAACGGSSNTLPVNLRTAGNFAVLSKSGVSTIPQSAITGDVGVSPAAATYLTGFSLIADASNQFATSTQIVGRAYAANYSDPTPSMMTTAIGDLETAFTDGAGRSPSVTELGAGNIGGMTLSPGVFSWSSGLLVPTNATLTGNANAVWILIVAQALTVSNGAHVELTGGALPKNVFWIVSGFVDLGTTSHMEGVVLGATSIDLKTGATINGRLLAQTAITLDSATVVQPAP